mmetsp:Transcript_10268/g.11515  ORF Transcript_10268/g.11515 Transcript_10268/m.11515 type:complete len:209 (-) Transcript_10268:166-792(-)
METNYCSRSRPSNNIQARKFTYRILRQKYRVAPSVDNNNYALSFEMKKANDLTEMPFIPRTLNCSSRSLDRMKSPMYLNSPFSNISSRPFGCIPKISKTVRKQAPISAWQSPPPQRPLLLSPQKEKIAPCESLDRGGNIKSNPRAAHLHSFKLKLEKGGKMNIFNVSPVNKRDFKFKVQRKERGKQACKTTKITSTISNLNTSDLIKQ